MVLLYVGISCKNDFVFYVQHVIKSYPAMLSAIIVTYCMVTYFQGCKVSRILCCFCRTSIIFIIEIVRSISPIVLPQNLYVKHSV